MKQDVASMVAVAVVSEQAVRHDGTVSVAAFSFATKRCVTISSCVCAGVDSVSGTPLNEPSTILVRRPLGPPQFIMVFFMSGRARGEHGISGSVHGS